jgi:N-acyl-D-amino-acid deacylase
MNRRHFLTLSAAATALPCYASAESTAALEAKLTKIVEDYMQKQGIPGGQLALGRAGKLVMSKGLGLADRDKNIAVSPRTLFRIASISKPLTAVAVLVLAEEGKLSLDAKMLEVLQPDIFLPDKDAKPDARLKDITIRHLLQHTGGWDRDKSGDVMFQARRIATRLGIVCPPGPADVIREVLARPLDDAPGTHYAYSNFGYCILGRIIEKVSGTGYGKFVQDRVLAPAGIKGPKLGSTLTQAEGETRYYMPNKNDGDEPVFPKLPDKVPSPYGAWCLETMDSHGGWIACAEDIVRFAMSLDDIGGTSPFKKKETWEMLLTPPPGVVGHDGDGKRLEKYYGGGFRVLHDKKGAGITHSGSLPGTTTFVWKRSDGWTWAAFFNLRQDGGGGKDGSVVEPLQKALDEASAEK